MFGILRSKAYNAYRYVMTAKFTQMDLIRWRGGYGLVFMLALGYYIEEWYYYTPETKPMAEDTYRKYIQWRKDTFNQALSKKQQSE